MALVHTSFHANPLETSRLSQRELLARIFGQHEAGEHAMDFEESSSDSGSDCEMEYNEGTLFVFFSLKVYSTWEIGEHFGPKTLGRFCIENVNKALAFYESPFAIAEKLTWALFSSKAFYFFQSKWKLLAFIFMVIFVFGRRFSVLFRAFIFGNIN